MGGWDILNNKRRHTKDKLRQNDNEEWQKVNDENLMEFLIALVLFAF
jgi:hypothetical protein